MPRRGKPVTETIASSEARRTWSQLLNRVHRDEPRVVIEKNGVAVAVLVSPDDLERLQRDEFQREQDFKIIDELQEAFKDVPPEEIQREVDKAVAEVRAERRRSLGTPVISQ